MRSGQGVWTRVKSASCLSAPSLLALSALLFCLLPVGCRADAEGAKKQDPFEAEEGKVSPPQTGDVLFHPTSGTFIDAQSVDLSILAGSGSIYFTTDGSLPTEASSVYESPLQLSSTTMIRAYRGGDSRVTEASYVAIDPQLRAFASNLPIVVLERHGDSPIETESDELRGSSVQFMEPSGDRTLLLGAATFSSRAGLRVRGASSRTFDQKSYSLELWNGGDDEDRKEPVLGMPKESDWVLIAPGDIDRSLMRTMLSFDLSRKIGAYAPRAQFVEVFLVDRAGSSALSPADYRGVYTFVEKIKRDPERVDVTRLNPEDTSGPALTGGYIFKRDHEVGPLQGFEWVYPEPEEMELPERSAQAEYLSGYLDEFFVSLKSEGFAHPVTGLHYSQYIDVPRWIDHNLLVALTKNVDGLRLSAYFHKEREGLLVAGPIWDFDRSMGSPHDGRTLDPEQWSEGDGTHPLQDSFWGELFADAEFEARYWQRWDQLSAGAFSVASLHEMIDDYETALEESRERHFEHWQQTPPQGGAAGEVQLLRDWLSARVPWLSAQRP